jgi:hypothetical protein
MGMTHLLYRPAGAAAEPGYFCRPGPANAALKPSRM